MIFGMLMFLRRCTAPVTHPCVQSKVLKKSCILLCAECSVHALLLLRSTSLTKAKKAMNEDMLKEIQIMLIMCF